MNVQNKAGYTAVMLASLTAPDGPDGMETVRKLMELGNLNVRSSQVTVNANNLRKITHKHVFYYFREFIRLQFNAD